MKCLSIIFDKCMHVGISKIKGTNMAGGRKETPPLLPLQEKNNVNVLEKHMVDVVALDGLLLNKCCSVNVRKDFFHFE